MHVSELFDESILQEHINNGLVSAKRNPDDDLTIYNYTPKAQYSRTWDDVTRNCRGLIVDDEGTITARPFPKFFNYGETDLYDEEITPDTEVVAYDKLDGSLGIVYWDKKGQPQVATRGSFTSVMAEHASERIKELLIPHFENVTMLVEIIYPENQIVLDYKGRDDLFLLGGVHIPSGQFLSPLDVFTEIRGVFPDGGFKYLAQDYREIKTVQDALNNLNRTNREGYVLHTDAGTMIKVKQDDYLAMHKAVFQTSKRTIWYGFAYDMLEKTGRSFEDAATKRIKALLPEIRETGGTSALFERIIPLIPNNLRDSVENTHEEFKAETKAKINEVISFLESRNFSVLERKDVYALASEHLGQGVAGIVTDIATSETDEKRATGFDRLVLSVVESIMPKKGERLTEALNEEDE